MALSRSTREQLRRIIVEVIEAGRRTDDPATARRMHQAAALLDTAAEMLDMAAAAEGALGSCAGASEGGKIPCFCEELD